MAELYGNKILLAETSGVQTRVLTHDLLHARRLFKPLGYHSFFVMYRHEYYAKYILMYLLFLGTPVSFLCLSFYKIMYQESGCKCIFEEGKLMCLCLKGVYDVEGSQQT